MSVIKIEDKEIGNGPDCYIIAEIGHNHQGDLDKARELFLAAKQCGVDAVKLQKRDNRSLFTRSMYDQPYDNENSFGKTYGAHREALEFGREEYRALSAYADELGLQMFATAFDMISADFLAELDMPAYKIASGDLTNIPLLRHVARLGKPMIVSTGAGDMADVRRACEAVLPLNPQLCLLQCTAAYPADQEDLNLRVIETFRREFPGVVVGLSDHENGIAMAIAAYVLGARVIEKHFTLNHTWKGTDHAFSLEPVGMRKLVRDLRRLPGALGDGVKKTLAVEVPARTKMGKTLVAARALAAGHRLTEGDIAIKTPGNGLPPYQLDNVIGRRLAEPLGQDDPLPASLLERQP